MYTSNKVGNYLIIIKKSSSIVDVRRSIDQGLFSHCFLIDRRFL